MGLSAGLSNGQDRHWTIKELMHGFTWIMEIPMNWSHDASMQGFDSVMIDASEKPLQENILITKKVVALASKYGACVEAELGYVAKLGQSTEKEGFTTPEEASRFVDETGVDALAIAIGTAHGFYKQEPRLDLEQAIPDPGDYECSACSARVKWCSSCNAQGCHCKGDL